MKKIVLSTAAMAVMAMSANAQKGSWYAGGTLGFNATKKKTETSGTSVDGTKVTNWSFSPEIGTFLTDNIQVGVGFKFNGEKTDYNTTPEHTNNTTRTGATLYARNFFFKGNFRPFVGLNIDVLPGKSTEKMGTSSVETSLFTFGANLNAGFAYALAPRVTVVGSFGALGFQSETEKNKATDVKKTTNSFGLDASSLGNRFTVGVYYTFKK